MTLSIKNSYGEFNESQPIGPAIWPHFDLIYIHDGHVSITMMGKNQIELHTGQAVLIYPETDLFGHSITTTTSVSVHHFKIITGADSNKHGGFEPFLHQSPPAIEHDIDRVVQLAYKTASPMLDEMRHALILLILTQLRMNESELPDIKHIETEFQAMIAWLYENIEHPVSLTDMAAKTGYSESHFRLLFKTQTGVTPGTYFFNMKMDEAAKLLNETLMPIKEISVQVGYRETSHFYRAFKAYKGITPAVYRKKYLLLG